MSVPRFHPNDSVHLELHAPIGVATGWLRLVVDSDVVTGKVIDVDATHVLVDFGHGVLVERANIASAQVYPPPMSEAAYARRSAAYVYATTEPGNPLRRGIGGYL